MTAHEKCSEAIRTTNMPLPGKFFRVTWGTTGPWGPCLGESMPWGIHALGKTQRTGDILVKAVDSAACDPHDQLLRDS
jgi:hypothetical protein